MYLSTSNASYFIQILHTFWIILRSSCQIVECFVAKQHVGAFINLRILHLSWQIKCHIIDADLIDCLGICYPDYPSLLFLANLELSHAEAFSQMAKYRHWLELPVFQDISLIKSLLKQYTNCQLCVFDRI